MRKKNFFLAVAAAIFIFILALRDVPPRAYPLLFDYHRVTPLSPFYCVKTFREFMQSKFTFGTEEEVYRYFNLADKRIMEAEYLKSAGAEALAKKQAKLAKDYQKKGSEYLKDLMDKVDINYLLQMESENANKLQAF